MNHVLSDRGESVVACGAPGSLARVQCERPALIEHIGVMRDIEEVEGRLAASDSSTLLAALLHNHGVDSPMESSAVMLAGGYSEESAGDVWRQLWLLQQNHVMATRPRAELAEPIALTPHLAR